MNNGKYVFSSVSEFLLKRVFDRLTSKYLMNRSNILLVGIKYYEWFLVKFLQEKV